MADLLAAILIICGLSFLVIKKLKQNRKAREAKEESQNQRMAAKVKELEFTNKQLKRQLEKVFKEFKKSKTQAENHKLSVACAMFGYTPQHIPDLQAISYAIDSYQSFIIRTQEAVKKK